MTSRSWVSYLLHSLITEEIQAIIVTVEEIECPGISPSKNLSINQMRFSSVENVYAFSSCSVIDSCILV